MKRIYIVRHAKSSWGDLSLADHQRPLNERGRRDAPVMASLCLAKQYTPDTIICSDANRAKETSQFFLKEFDLKEGLYRLESGLYHAPSDKYFEEASLLDEQYSSVMMFGHNPGITYLANEVSSNFIDNVPTSGVLVIDSTAKTWSEIDPSNCKLVDFLYPKMLDK